MPSREKEFNLKLVQEIERYPCLYNYKYNKYSSRDAIVDAWKSVALEMDESVSKCLNKWKNIRTVFVRKMKDNTNTTNPYYLTKAMSFLIPFIKGPRVSRELPSSSTNEYIDNIFEVAELSHEEEYQPEEQFEEELNNMFSIEAKPEYIEIDANGRITYSPPEEEEEREEELHERCIAYSPLEEATVKKQQQQQYGKRIKYSPPKEVKTEETKHGRNEDVSTSPEKIYKMDEEPRKCFLLSLLPDVHKLSDYQMRVFKRNVLQVLDDLLDST